MRLLVLLFPLTFVLLSAFWSYNEHNVTRKVSERVNRLSADIIKGRDTLDVLHDEWEVLNRPERLIRLVNQHYDELRLSNVTLGRIRDISTVPFRDRSVPSLDSETGLLLAAPVAIRPGR